MKILLVPLVAILASCASIADLATRDCQRAGYVEGTPEFAQCFQIVGQHHAIKRQNALQGLSQTGSGMMLMSVPQQRPMTTCFQSGMYFMCQ